MINVWADLAKMKRDFPIGHLIIIVEATNGSNYWEDHIGRIAKVEGYAIEEGMLYAVFENGMEIAIFPDEAELYFASQVC